MIKPRKMTKEEFTEIINLQREKLAKSNELTTDMFNQGMNLLDDESRKFITEFIAHSTKQIEDEISQYYKDNAWNHGWSKSDMFFTLNFKAWFPLLYYSKFNLSGNKARIENSYKRMSHTLVHDHEFIDGWGEIFFRLYGKYKKDMREANLYGLLEWPKKQDKAMMGLPTGVAGDIIFAMKSFKKLAPKLYKEKLISERNELVMIRIKQGKMQKEIAKEVGVEQGTVSKIADKMRVKQNG